MDDTKIKKNNPSEESTELLKRENILKNWLHLAVFVGVFALLSILTLEFIDKDKR
ncbi:MAG: hypothetical protein II640_03660 [Lachnospiraceae bacterium]|nr:hypothetical protein [Lachnospiraceae bacterium]